MSISRPAYSAPHAWLRAAIYFAVCLSMAHLSGALAIVLNQPLATPAQLADIYWILFTGFCVLIELWAYAFIWRKGTVHHGRSLSLPAVLIFGTSWGLSEGLLFVSVYQVFNGWLGISFWASALTFIVLSAFLGLWHQFYWDIYVAPEHNIESWNLKKVLLGHIPNLAVTLTYLSMYQNFGIFVLLQTLALLISTFFMRFPPFWQKQEI